MQVFSRRLCDRLGGRLGRVVLLSGLLPLFGMGHLACDSSGTGAGPLDGGADAGPRDLARSPTDLPPPMVSLPTSCATASPTAAQIFDPVFKGRCDNTNCHGGPLLPTLKRATDLPLMVGQSSASDLPLVDSGFNVNRSYLLYKLTGEVWKVPHGGGDAMPPNSGLIDDASLCLVANWIRSGAR